jgi:hypothetical protein
MMAHPELVGGDRRRFDTDLMRTLPGRVVSKGGAEGVRAVGALAAASTAAPFGLAIKVEDGDLARRAGDVAASAVLARLGVTDARVHAAIQDSTPAPSPTAARSCAVYLPVGKSIFKNGGKVYPDLATAQAAHPDQGIAPFAIQLAEGEFFDVGTVHPRFSSWGKFASYADAFAAAEDFKDVQGADVSIRILVPDVMELRGKDSAGRDVVLGRSVEYSHVRMMSRIAATID